MIQPIKPHRGWIDLVVYSLEDAPKKASGVT